MGESSVGHGVASQLLAALEMLKDCIDRCPENQWDERHNDYPFSYVVFHALNDCDYHLCDDQDTFRTQEFHIENRKRFGDYEELEGQITERLYDRAFIIAYYEHCRVKVQSAIEAKSDSELVIPNSDVNRNMTRLERYINVIRHMQHHASQLGFRLQLATGNEMEWVPRGHEGYV